MCLIVFSYKRHSDFPLILAANRDEFYGRPTQPAHLWETSPKILAGKDEQAGGTWLGISENGRIAALTNYRDMADIKENTTSRGIIVKDFLLSDAHPREYLTKLQNYSDQFNGFNLIAGTVGNLYYISNKKEGVFEIQPGTHAISNAFLNTPWPKTKYASKTLENIINSNGPNEKELFNMLQNEQRYSDKDLPDTGLTREMEKAVSSVFIKTESYGTRSSTLLMFDQKSTVHFIEKSYVPGTKQVNFTVRKVLDTH